MEILMKKLVIVAFLFVAINVSAKILKCEVVDPTNPTSWPNEYILIQLDHNVTYLDYIHKIPNSDGTFTDKIEKFYEGLNRGGHVVSYCNPNENDYDRLSGRISLYSQCNLEDGGKLFFDASLSLKESGTIDILILPYTSGTIERKIDVSICL